MTTRHRANACDISRITMPVAITSFASRIGRHFYRASPTSYMIKRGDYSMRLSRPLQAALTTSMKQSSAKPRHIASLSTSTGSAWHTQPRSSIKERTHAFHDALIFYISRMHSPLYFHTSARMSHAQLYFPSSAIISILHIFYASSRNGAPQHRFYTPSAADDIRAQKRLFRDSSYDHARCFHL